MKNIYFKLLRTYGNDYISIEEAELEKAIYAQLSGDIFVGPGGTVAGNKIEMIVLDINRSAGFNEGYRLLPEDWGYVRRDFGGHDLRDLAEKKFLAASDKVKLYVEQNRTDLIGKDMPRLRAAA